MAVAMVLSEISYAQVGLAVMGARRIKKRMEKEQAKEENNSAQKAESDIDAGNAGEDNMASACQKDQPAECR
jgi:Flp pilus assembly protein TadB